MRTNPLLGPEGDLQMRERIEMNSITARLKEQERSLQTAADDQRKSILTEIGRLKQRYAELEKMQPGR